MAKIIIVMIFVTLASTVFQFVMIKRGNEQGKYLSTLLRKLDDESDFFEYADYAIENEKNPEFLEKIKLMKAWGFAYYSRFEEYTAAIKNVDFKRLVSNGKKSRVKENEDAFFYLHLIIPNHLYGCKRMDLVDELFELNNTVKSELENTLTYQIYQANMRYYTRTGDLGGPLYEEILSGDYGQFTYNKQLIGIYKNIVTAMLAAVYKEMNDHNRYSTLDDDLEFFASMPLGLRWMKELGLTIPKGATLPAEESK